MKRKQVSPVFESQNLPAPSHGSPIEGSRQKVVEALKHFEEIFQKLWQEEERVPKNQRKASATNRIGMKAAKILEEKLDNIEQVFGHVPGIEIGDRFQYRAELFVVGLHRHCCSGIDTIKFHDQLFAISIVNSGRYDNETKSVNTFIYHGEGGNPTVSSDIKPKDQQMVRGNVALKNSMIKKYPVRVIRYCQTSDTLGMNNGKGFAYAYDGLYRVKRYWPERSAKSGKWVFKFEMERYPNQTNLTHGISPRSR